MNVKLTKRKAWELISRIHPRLNIRQEATPPDVAIFKASTGPEGLEIRCENDWFNHNGRIKLTIANVDGGSPIIRYLHTLIKRNADDNKALKLGVQALLRSQMISDFNKYSEKGYAPIYARESFENCWTQYHSLGVNGVMDNLHEKFLELPTEPPDE